MVSEGVKRSEDLPTTSTTDGAQQSVLGAGMHAHVLLTGATGFLGKQVLRALLVGTADGDATAIAADHVSILVREKKGESPNFRLDALKESSCFLGMDPKLWQRVSLVSGALASDLGGSLLKALPTQEVTHVIHCAASIRFDMTIEQAVDENVKLPVALMAWARTCPKLQRFVFVSTAYVHPPTHPDDKDGPREHERPVHAFGLATFRAMLKDDFLPSFEDAATRMGHPNTYTWSKAMCERVLWELVEEDRPSFQISFVRPSIISVSETIPHPGWSDAPSTCVGAITALTTGLIRGVRASVVNNVNVVPVDFVARVTSRECLSSVHYGTTMRAVHVVAGERHEIMMRDMIWYCYREMERRGCRRRLFYSSTGMWANAAAQVTEQIPLKTAALFWKLVGKPRQSLKMRRLAQTAASVNAQFEPFWNNTWRWTAGEATYRCVIAPCNQLAEVCGVQPVPVSRKSGSHVDDTEALLVSRGVPPYLFILAMGGVDYAISNFPTMVISRPDPKTLRRNRILKIVGALLLVWWTLKLGRVRSTRRRQQLLV